MELPGLADLHSLRHDAFLSYSWADDQPARALHGELSPQMKVFFAPVDLAPEVQRQARFQFANLLMDALTYSAHFVALLSVRYLESAWCNLEMQGFANLHRLDSARRLWLFEIEPCRTALPAALRGLVFEGEREALLRTVLQTVAGGVRPRGYAIGQPLHPCLPGLPLRRLYRPPKGAPWGFESQSRGLSPVRRLTASTKAWYASTWCKCCAGADGAFWLSRTISPNSKCRWTDWTRATNA